MSKVLSALVLKYANILDVAKFCIWQGYNYANVTQGSEYARIYFDMVLNMSGF